MAVGRSRSMLVGGGGGAVSRVTKIYDRRTGGAWVRFADHTTSFPPSRPNATVMYSKLFQYPSPKGILRLAEHNWSTSPTRRFYDNSYLAPTPSITTIQKLGLSITKAFALHIRYASRKFVDHPAHTLPPSVLNPSYPGQ
jgi:hypothetical protein